MFSFFSKKRAEKKAKDEAEAKAAHSQKLREEAMANARAAREALGDETIQKIAAAMNRKEQSNVEQAKRAIHKADPDRVLDEFKFMLDKKNQD